MGVECTINGVPVKFPFPPYDIQKDYMSKVIECLQNGKHGVLESPTGTGKTLSLLCSSLAWLEIKKAQVQAQWHSIDSTEKEKFLDTINSIGGAGANRNPRSMLLNMPQIIYSSRTHTQLSQAVQELKRTSYRYMKACVIGSREQMCIHSEVMSEESNIMKNNLCQIKVKSRSCLFYNRVEKLKDGPLLLEQPVVDIEDLVGMGQKNKFCPYFMAKELRQSADVVFMPYNYLLDARSRKALGIDLANNIIILDEAHNVEKMCEESASLQIKSTDIALCIDEITEVMKAISDENNDFSSYKDSPPDFSPDDLCILKQMMLDFEKALDSINIENHSTGTTFDGDYIFRLLDQCGINDQNHYSVSGILEKIILFLSTVNQGPFQRKGNGLSQFFDLLEIAFVSSKPEFKEKIKKCYKVHVIVEDTQNQRQGNTWLPKAKPKAACRVLSYWCFSPGFGMNMLMEKGAKCVILTSGTLAPLKPLIMELEMDIGVQLENPHIVTGKQICVKILSKGPDGEELNCSYRNRDNPAYLKSLGMTISNLVKFIPDGMLIFFPSYPIMAKCQERWQSEGIWSSICSQKPIFVEPKRKPAFQEAMTNYYDSINNPSIKGAIFMGVCRGKVSEGLDFADANGRAVIIIGLPYPPLMDPKIVLKKKYLDVCRSANKEYIGGDDWYSLEAVKAVNQAIGRIIRHRHDYGAILLLDSRFNSPRITNQMSKWLRQHIYNVKNYREIVVALRSFFKEVQEQFPVVKSAPREPEPIGIPANALVKNERASTAMFDFSTSSSTSSLNAKPEQEAHAYNAAKRKKINLIPNKPSTNPSITIDDVKEYLVMVKKQLNQAEYRSFMEALKNYRANGDFDSFTDVVDRIFLSKLHLGFIVLGLQTYIKVEHVEQFGVYCQKFK